MSDRRYGRNYHSVVLDRCTLFFILPISHVHCIHRIHVAFMQAPQWHTAADAREETWRFVREGKKKWAARGLLYLVLAPMLFLVISSRHASGMWVTNELEVTKHGHSSIHQSTPLRPKMVPSLPGHLGLLGI